MKIIEYETNFNKIKRYQKNNNINFDILNFLINRGYSEREIYLLTNNNFEDLLPYDNITNICEASQLIDKYLHIENSNIYVYSDYDSDGINSGVIFYDTLNKIIKCLNLKCKINLYIPQRAEGYGINMKWCKELISNNINNNTLVITADNGISKKNEVNFLKKNNIEVLVTDHHQPQKDLIPQNVLIVNPCVNDVNNKNAIGLCGTAIVYKICSYILNILYKDKSNYNDIYLPNVAIATITDMMPITEENIIFVRNGLKYFNNNYCLKPLIYYKNYVNKEIKPKDIAFDLGPQLNSCGRMGQVDKGVEFLLSVDNNDIENIYNDIVILNDKRKENTKELIELCKDKITEAHNIIILKIKNLGGIGGNVANQLLNIYDKPIILLNDNYFENNDDDILTGTCRSNNINLQQLFKISQDNNLIVSFGGHNNAAGIEIRRKDITKFREFCNIQTPKLLKSTKKEDTLYVDKIITVKDLNIDTIKKYENILYFNDLKEPLFALKNIHIDNIRYSKNNNKNMCFFFSDENGNKSPGIWCWKFKDIYEKINSPIYINIVFSLSNFKDMLVMNIEYIEDANNKK